MYCRLCGSAINDYSRVIDDDIKNKLNIILPQQNFTDNIQHVMCRVCTEKIFAAFNFKTMCLQTDNTICPYVGCEKSVPVDLKDIYRKEKVFKGITDVLAGMGICRFCMQPVGVECIPLQNVPVEAIQIYIPEMNIHMTTDPVFCMQCHDSLLTHSNFVRLCLLVDKKKIKRASENIKIEQIDIKIEREHDDEEEKPIEALYVGVKSEKIEVESDGSQFVIAETDLNLIKKYNSEEFTQNNEYFDERFGEKDPLDVKAYKCDKCESAFKFRYNLMRHRLKHMDPSEVNMFKCVQCRFETKYKHGFMNHQLSHKDPSEMQMHKCDKCPFETKYKNSFNKHQLTHTDPSEVVFYKCDKCKFETKHKRNFMTHQVIHMDPSEVKMYRCDKCRFQTKYSSSLKVHQLTHKDPSQIPKHKCDECNRVYKSKRNLVEHQKTHPEEGLIYKCDRCEYVGTHKRYLKIHSLQHKDRSKVQMHKCDKCDYETLHKRCLSVHQLKHKDSSNTEMYKCDECQFETKYKKNLGKHKKRHRACTEVLT